MLGAEYVNRAEVEFRVVDGAIVDTSYVISEITVEDFEGQLVPTGWHPPDWNFSYTDDITEMRCEALCPYMG
jgi:hypothetical protein